MHVLEAALAANLKLHSLRTANAATSSEWPAGWWPAVPLTAALAAITAFILAMDLSATDAAARRPMQIVEAR